LHHKGYPNVAIKLSPNGVNVDVISPCVPEFASLTSLGNARNSGFGSANQTSQPKGDKRSGVSLGVALAVTGVMGMIASRQRDAIPGLPCRSLASAVTRQCPRWTECAEHSRFDWTTGLYVPGVKCYKVGMCELGRFLLRGNKVTSGLLGPSRRLLRGGRQRKVEVGGTVLRMGLNLSLVAWWVVRGIPTGQSLRRRQELKNSLRLIRGTRDVARRRSA
jgi:hypothetical protein